MSGTGGRPETCAVVGGGIVGAACAFRLQRAGFGVTLLDPGDPRRAAAYGNIGHIAAEQCAPLASLSSLASFPSRLFAFGGPLDFRLRDVGLWLPWAARFAAASLPGRHAAGVKALTGLLGPALDAWLDLADQAQLPPGTVRAEGHGAVWFDPARAAKGMAAWETAPRGSVSLRPMTGDELDSYGETLSRAPAGGLRFEGTGQVSDPGGLHQGLLRAFEAAGGRVVQASVRDLAASPDGVRVDLEGREPVAADLALVAAGAGSARVLRGLGASAPLIGERGYSIQSLRHGWPGTLPLTVFEEMSVVAAAFDSGLRLSGMVEIGSPYAPPDARKWERLESQAKALGLPMDGPLDRWCGPRPTLPDYLPAIGRLEAAPRVLYAFGHQHLGLTSAAVTAGWIETLARGEAQPEGLAAFRVERFG